MPRTAGFRFRPMSDVTAPPPVALTLKDDFSGMPLVRAAAGARVVKIPAPLARYWLGLLEVEAAGRQ
jgi:hypothetical protein